jgi:hypothetical protein
MAPDVRARHERIRSGLHRWILEDGAIMSQPLSEGIARGATAGVATTATPVPGGFHVSGRRAFASLAGAADAYNFTCRVPGEEGLRFLSVHSDNPGVRIVGDWDPLGMRGTDSRTLVFEDAFVESDDELLPTGGFDQLAARWPHVYLTLTPTYIGLTRVVVDFVQGYLGSTPPPGVPARRDVPAKQWAWAEIQIAYERSRSLWECAVAEAGLDPTPEQLRRLGGGLHGDGDGARGRRTAIAPAAEARRMRNLPLEHHGTRCGSCAALERRGVPELLVASASTTSPTITACSSGPPPATWDAARGLAGGRPGPLCCSRRPRHDAHGVRPQLTALSPSPLRGLGCPATASPLPSQGLRSRRWPMRSRRRRTLEKRRILRARWAVDRAAHGPRHPRWCIPGAARLEPAFGLDGTEPEAQRLASIRWTPARPCEHG